MCQRYCYGLSPFRALAKPFLVCSAYSFATNDLGLRFLPGFDTQYNRSGIFPRPGLSHHFHASGGRANGLLVLILGCSWAFRKLGLLCVCSWWADTKGPDVGR